jgi:hypothetical protein
VGPGLKASGALEPLGFLEFLQLEARRPAGAD